MGKSRNFEKWCPMTLNWSEIAFDFNTGKKYQHKQDLYAIFHNSYIYYESKVTNYYEHFGVLPNDYLNELIFDFRKHFSQAGRIIGINYFDDLLELLMDKLIKSKSLENATYSIYPIEDYGITNDQTYKWALRECTNFGYVNCKINGINIKLFSPILSYILMCKKLKCKQIGKNYNVELNGNDFLDSFTKGISDGISEFESQFKIGPNIVYGEYSKQYVDDLHYNYFHSKIEYNNTTDGWSFVKNKSPFIFSKLTIEKFGFYTALVNKTDEQAIKHPTLFKDFYSCEISSDDSNKEKEQSNPFPHIFKNINYYNFFIDLKEHIVNKETELADYGFIYFRLKELQNNTIFSTMKHRYFINFVNENYNANIVDVKFTYRKPTKKMTIYNTILTKYKDLL